jgi:small subunit ribosomal protein S6
MNKYELAVLYHPDLEIDLEKAEGRVKDLITSLGGKITDTDNWGKKKTAYPVEGHEHAVYVFYQVEIEGKQVSELNNSLNIVDEVIRFLLTKPDFKARKKAEEMAAKRDKRHANNKDEPEDEESDDEE